jgi:GTP-binding protein
MGDHASGGRDLNAPIAATDLFPPRPLGADETEAGRLLFARDCRFVAGAADEAALPPESLPEIAFVGRSNVGKSSLVNALTGRRTLARTSNTPGRTRQLNFFALDDRLMLVDLPGYGYAEASKRAIEGWTRLMRNYLRGRSRLRRVCLPYQAVLTKIDRLGPEPRIAVACTVAAELARHNAAHPEIHLTSAEKRLGIAALRATLAGFADMELPRHKR